jgi:hypothetical protein
MLPHFGHPPLAGPEILFDMMRLLPKSESISLTCRLFSMARRFSMAEEKPDA